MKKSILLKGQTILEVVIAAALISVAIIAALSLSNTTAKETTYSRDFNRATQYNTEAVDWIRSMRDSLGWPSLVDTLTSDSPLSVVYCLDSLVTTTAEFIALSNASCGAGEYITGTIFIREITIDLASAATGEVGVSVTTSWTGNLPHSVSTETKINRW